MRPGDAILDRVVERLVQLRRDESRAERGRGMAIGRDRRGQQAGPSNQSVTAPPPPSLA